MKLVKESLYEYLELPSKSQKDIIKDLSKLNKQELTMEFINVCHYGKKYLINLLLSNGVDINNSDSYDITPLMHSIHSNSYDIVKLLINNGSDVNHISKVTGATALSIALKYKNKDIIELLKGAGAKS